MGGAISSIFGGGGSGNKLAPIAPAPPPAPTIDNSAAVEAAAREERLRVSKMKGRASTKLTEGTGVSMKEEENSYVSGRGRLLG